MDALIVGTGLIGASIGAALRRQGWSVVGWDPAEEALAGAFEIGALNGTVASIEEADGADLIVLAAPVGAIIATLGSLATDVLVTDVAGVKTTVVKAAAHLSHFVGGHPMAGRESSGPGAANAAMFEGASWILTTDGVDPADMERMEALVESMGATPVRMSAADHDAAVAAVSHVPQVLASSLVNMVGANSDALALAAGGFRDVTRIALSEPAWWTDILTENREEVTSLIRALSADLGAWADRIDAGDREGVAAGLGSARSTRRRLAPPVAAVQVLLEDRPGEIARVGHALAEASVDVRDLQLRHATRGGGGVLTLSVPPGQEEALVEALRAEGFRLVG
jgi:prephenate dehydrogenase